EWAGFTFEYLKKRTNLLCTFVLIDVRHEPQKLDIALMEWLSEKQIPFVIVFTKCDKLTTNHVNAHVASYKNYMLESWESLPEIFMTSAEKNKGKEHILEFIEQVIENTTL
ncbi:MAG TPA: GTP-binding protein, partial [Flavobacteriales bacterium]|nr:GTP-binding protein [Flavobacteriales bacterium]